MFGNKTQRPLTLPAVPSLPSVPLQKRFMSDGKLIAVLCSPVTDRNDDVTTLAVMLLRGTMEHQLETCQNDEQTEFLTS